MIPVQRGSCRIQARKAPQVRRAEVVPEGIGIAIDGATSRARVECVPTRSRRSPRVPEADEGHGQDGSNNHPCPVIPQPAPSLITVLLPPMFACDDMPPRQIWVSAPGRSVVLEQRH